MGLKVIIFVAFAGVVTVFTAPPNGHVEKGPVQIVPREDVCNETCTTACLIHLGLENCTGTDCYCEIAGTRNVPHQPRISIDSCDVTCNDVCASYGLSCVGISCWCEV